jgi:hypothetical protein
VSAPFSAGGVRPRHGKSICRSHRHRRNIRS